MGPGMQASFFFCFGFFGFFWFWLNSSKFTCRWPEAGKTRQGPKCACWEFTCPYHRDGIGNKQERERLRKTKTLVLVCALFVCVCQLALKNMDSYMGVNLK